METTCYTVKPAISEVCLLSNDLTVGGLVRFRSNRGRLFKRPAWLPSASIGEQPGSEMNEKVNSIILFSGFYHLHHRVIKYCTTTDGVNKSGVA